jgi:FkbM family methyltransferase
MNIYKLKISIKKELKQKSFSQFGEDALLLEIFKNNKTPVCIDVGANDGDYGSNSALLESNGWICVLVEPNPILCKKIIRDRKPYRLFEYAASSKEAVVNLYLVNGGLLAHGLSTLEPNYENMKRIKENNFSYEKIKVKSRTLDSMLSEAGLTKVDVVSIDVEGHELDVLKGFAFKKWSPRIFIIEDNSVFKSNKISFYMNKRGYKPFFRSGVNDWYAHYNDKELITTFHISFYKINKFYQFIKCILFRLAIVIFRYFKIS